MFKYFILVGAAFLLSGCTPAAQTPTQDSIPVEESSKEEMTIETKTLEETTMEEKTYTLNEMAEHASQDDCWTVVDGTVADITGFFGKHPGGHENLAKACGVDASEIFASVKKHDPNGYAKVMELKIGTLAQ